MDFDKFRHVAEIGNQRHLGAFTTKSEADRVDGIMRNREGMNLDIANHKALAGMNSFNTVDTFAKCFRQAAPESIHGGFRNVKWSFPESKHLRQAVAMVGVFVGDEDAVEMIDDHFNSDQSRKRFALA